LPETREKELRFNQERKMGVAREGLGKRDKPGSGGGGIGRAKGEP